MKIKESQKKYPEFIYESFQYEFRGNNLAINFKFKILPAIEFNPSIVIKNVDRKQAEKIGKENLQNLIFHLGLAEMPTYWKTVCAPKIVIGAGYLNKNQIKFWQNLFLNGMGQFFFENKLPFIKPKFIIQCKFSDNFFCARQKFSSRCLVPLGGGKDSLVTLEILRQTKPVITFVLNPNRAINDLLKTAGGQSIFIERKIDKRLLALNQQGFFNGHTPFSALLAFLSITAAALFDCQYIPISQERSSNEGNLKYLGKIINHQYSKSFKFENQVRAYCKKYLAENIEYFSFLRPFYELQIAKIFAKYPKYFPYFVSCNNSFTFVGRKTNSNKWCCACPKCLFTFAAIYPFIGKEGATAVFEKNLFEEKGLLPIMLKLLGEREYKPFECVGTFSEARVAFYLAAQKTNNPKPYLLNYFEKNILPKYPSIANEAKKILTAWNDKNNLPLFFEKLLKNYC